MENVNISATDIPALVKFAQDKQIGLTIVGPEAPLVIGVVDAFREAGLKFWPNSSGCTIGRFKSIYQRFPSRVIKSQRQNIKTSPK